jgi:hypothetical protein
LFSFASRPLKGARIRRGERCRAGYASLDHHYVSC